MITRIEILGRPRVRLGVQVLDKFPTQKTVALLGLLALEEGGQLTREHLAQTLWPDAEPTAGRNRLNQTISTLRKFVGDALESDSKRVWLGAASYSLDLADFNNINAEEIEEVEESLVLYRGPLLEGLNESWLSGHRARLHELVSSRIATLLRSALDAEDFQTALGFAHQLIEHDPADMEAHSALIRLHLLQKRPHAALRHFDSIKRLHGQVNLPEDVQQELRKALAGSSASAGIEVHDFATRLPSYNDPLVGRESEIQILSERIRSGHRLQVLQGPGGVGKTRLAVAAAVALIPDFKGRVAFISAGKAKTMHDLRGVILDVLTEGKNTAIHQFHQIMSRMEPTRPFLLVLDSPEHLIDEKQQVLAALQAYPGVHLLVTSRLKLDLKGVETFVVEPFSNEGSDAAVTLFKHHYSRIRPSYTYRDADSRAISQIVSHLDGLPMAIELSASWARTLTPTQIAERIVINPRLVQDSQAAGSRVESLLLQSRRLLGAERWSGFVKLCTLVGDFSLEALEFVLGEDALFLLRNYEDHSLLRSEIDAIGHQRYRILDPIREFTLATASRADLDAGMEAAISYCLELAERTEERTNSAWHYGALREVNADRGTLEFVFEFLVGANRLEEAIRLANNMGLYWRHLQDWKSGVEGLMNLIELARVNHRPTLEIASLQLNLGGVLRIMGQAEQARDLYAEVAEVFEEAGDTPKLLRAKLGLAAYYHAIEDSKTQTQILLETLEISSQVGDPVIESYTRSRLGNMATDEGRYAEAKEHYENSIRLARAAKNDSFEASGLQALANLNFLQKKYQTALELNQLSLEISESNMEHHLTGDTEISIARCWIQLGERGLAARVLEAQIEEIPVAHSLKTVLTIALAELALGQNDHELCAKFIGFLKSNEVTGKVSSDRISKAIAIPKAGAETALGADFESFAGIGAIWRDSDFLAAAKDLVKEIISDAAELKLVSNP